MVIKVKSVEARVFVHATEDKNKVLEALKNVTGQRNIVEEEELRGYFGNPITVITVTLEGEEAESAFRRVMSSLPSTDKAYLAASLEDRVDKAGNLHLRLDKQKAFKGILTLSDTDDVIKLVIRLSGAKNLDTDELVRELLGEV